MLAGRGGVLLKDMYKRFFKDQHPVNSPINNRVAQAYMGQHRFEPTYEFTNVFPLEDVAFVTWQTLFEWIPSRLSCWVDYLHETIPYNQRPIWRIAHRGASAHAQEGSATSIHIAKELGADMIEIDLRFTKDNVPIMFHDNSLSRVFGVNQMVNEVTLEELKAITPDGKEPVMTFEEMVALCKELRLGLYLDIKNINAQGMATVFEIVDEARWGSYCIFSSFRADWVAEIKAQRPNAITSILFSSIHVDPVSLAQALKTDYVHPCFERYDEPQQYISGEWIEKVRAANLGVVCWHEERPEVIAALYELGVDGICSDEPELLTAEAERRGVL